MALNHRDTSPMRGIEHSKHNLARDTRLIDLSDEEDVHHGLSRLEVAEPGELHEERKTDHASTASGRRVSNAVSQLPRRIIIPTRPSARTARSARFAAERERQARAYQEYLAYWDWLDWQRTGAIQEEHYLASNTRALPSAYLNEMTDVDARRQGGNYNNNSRSYGGGGGGRKRKFYGDDDDVDRPRQRRDFQRKVPLSVRVREQLITIADSAVRNAEEDCAAIASTIAENHEDSYFCNHIKDVIPQLVIEQPLKIPHAAAVVLHVNDKRPEIVAQILEKARDMAQLAINTGEWRSLKLLLRFFAAIHPVFDGSGSGLVGLLEVLFSRASDLQMASSEDALGIELVKIILITIPFALASGVGSQSVTELLEKTDIIVSAPQEGGLSIDPFTSSEGEQVSQSSTLIALLQRQLQQEAQQGYPLKIVPRLYYKATKDAEMDAEEEEGPHKHPFPSLDVPEQLIPGPRPLFNEVFFSLYADQDVETVPPTSTLASSLIRDVCVDTLNILDFNRDKAVRYLIDLDNYFPADTFAKRGTPFDKIRDSDMPTWKPEDLLMDAIYSQLLTLPAPEHKLVYYHSCITVACREAAAAVAPSLGRAIRFLYRGLDVMDLELGYRFMDWFSHHLSNYDFRWKWQEWSEDVASLPTLSPKNAFIRGVIDKEIRLSFARRIRESLPDVYWQLIPESKDNDIPEFKFNSDDTPFASEAKTILNALKRKQADTDILPTLSTITEQAGALPAIDAYVTSLCYIGSKSLSHVLSYIERCKHRLLAFSREAPDPSAANAARMQIIQSVVDYWRNTQAGVAVNIVDKLLNYGIVSPSSVVAWALGAASDSGPPTGPRADHATSLPEAWLYEMVAGTLAKVTGRVRQIVAARLAGGLGAAQLAQVDETLDREAADMRALFASVDAALADVADGAAPGVDGEAAAFLRWWGARWMRVFERKRRVEERLLAEATPRFPGAVAEPDVPMDGAENGAEAEGSNGAAQHADVEPGADADADADGV